MKNVYIAFFLLLVQIILAGIMFQFNLPIIGIALIATSAITFIGIAVLLEER